MFNLVIFGPPGAGKGTQSVKIAQKYRFGHISTGDLLRNEIKNQTPLGLKVRDIIEKGELVPDELLIDLLKDAMHKHNDVKGFIFDGFPRTLVQAEELDRFLRGEGQRINLTLALEVEEEELIKRILHRAMESDRTDDTEEVIQNRLLVYHKQTKPLIEYYREQGKFESVFGKGTIEQIFGKLCAVIDKHLHLGT
jgi:adenylate kinase